MEDRRTQTAARNGAIDVYKFLFSWIVVFYHFYSKTHKYFAHGNIGVEFFVLVSGIYFYMSWEKTKQRRVGEDLSFYPYEYTKKRFARFFPYTTTAFAGAFVVIGLIIKKFQNKDAFTFFARCCDYIWEILLIGGRNGMMQNDLLNSPVWTICAMLVTDFFILCILVRWEKLFYTMISPISVLVIYGYWRHMESTYNNEWIGFTTFGVLRVFALTCVAYFCYCLAKRLEETKFTRSGVLLLSGCEAVCFLLVFLIIMNPDNKSTRFVGTLLLCVGCAVTMSGKSFSTKMFPDTWVSRWLGELSFAIYLVHRPISRWFEFLVPNPDEMYAYKFGFLFAVLAASIAFLPLVKAVSKTASRFCSWVRPKLIESEAQEK